MEQPISMVRVNIGCGQTPTDGWKNFDNSFSLRLSRIPLIPVLLHRLRFLDGSQYQFTKFAREHDIEYGDATKGLPLTNESCEGIYSSHMLEHLDRNEADKFLEEAYRILRPNGIIRMAVPDIRKQIKQYNESGDADAFVEATHMCVPRPTSLAQKVRLLLVGTRHHQWMYDGYSLSRLIHKHGFIEAEVMPPGKTKFSEPGSLDLQDRLCESVYVEARKPSA
jgi:predicted SAM-dependent methyltransferase